MGDVIVAKDWWVYSECAAEGEELRISRTFTVSFDGVEALRLVEVIVVKVWRSWFPFGCSFVYNWTRYKDTNHIRRRSSDRYI